MSADSLPKIVLCCSLRLVPLMFIGADHTWRRSFAQVDLNVLPMFAMFRLVTCIAQWRTLAEVLWIQQYMFLRYNRWRRARNLFSRLYFPYRAMIGPVIREGMFGRTDILMPIKFFWAYIRACSRVDDSSSQETPSNFPI